MSIDIYLQKKIQAPRRNSDDEWLGQIDDNDYHALSAFFENLRQNTGQNVDLYGDAAFGGDNLDVLKIALDEAKIWLDAQPTSWKVTLGFQIAPQHQEIIALVQCQALQKILGALEIALERAKLQNCVITFWGD